MERLTFRSGKKVYLYHADACWAGKPIKERAFCHDHKCASDPNFDRRKCGVCNLIDRLAAYEDTGLEPEEIVSRKELDQLSCVIDLLNNCQQFNESIDRLRELAEADKEGRCVVLPCKVGDTIYKIPSKVNFELNVLTNHSENNRVYEQIVNKAEIYDNAYLLVTCDGMDSVFSAFFENSWFLTREAAEAALKEREQNE